mmetsp:Transcript_53722/g.166828  ORF Transcript_53722/g.166828 Transcript_53722/m.166828 type:complete len:301 (-) Transcript_53722:707-1609(-)
MCLDRLDRLPGGRSRKAFRSRLAAGGPDARSLGRSLPRQGGQARAAGRAAPGRSGESEGRVPLGRPRSAQPGHGGGRRRPGRARGPQPRGAAAVAPGDAGLLGDLRALLASQEGHPLAARPLCGPCAVLPGVSCDTHGGGHAVLQVSWRLRQQVPGLLERRLDLRVRQAVLLCFQRAPDDRVFLGLHLLHVFPGRASGHGARGCPLPQARHRGEPRPVGERGRQPLPGAVGGSSPYQAVPGHRLSLRHPLRHGWWLCQCRGRRAGSLHRHGRQGGAAHRRLGHVGAWHAPGLEPRVPGWQ